MTVFLLGPSRKDDGSTEPLDMRRELRRRMEFTGIRSMVMEDIGDRPGENNLAKFQRIVDMERVTTYAILIPLESRLHGVSVEIGHLLTRIQKDGLDPARVHLLLQALAASVDDEGIVALNEEGNRTRYYEDLIDEGCPIHRWADWVELNHHAAAIALEDDLISVGLRD